MVQVPLWRVFQSQIGCYFGYLCLRRIFPDVIPVRRQAQNAVTTINLGENGFDFGYDGAYAEIVSNAVLQEMLSVKEVDLR